MADPPAQAQKLLDRAIESGRIHSSYLLSGPSAVVQEAALRFARALVCRGVGPRPCEDCGECRRSSESDEPVELDGSGKKGPLYRHIGDHPDLYWVDKGGEGTRVRIGQIRATQKALRLGANEGGYRVAVIADAEWMNQESQNSLLKLLEEPPDRTCLILASASTAPLVATIRSRCQKVRFPDDNKGDLRAGDLSEDRSRVLSRFDRIDSAGLPELLDWAEEYRGNRARAAEDVEVLLEIGSAWLNEQTRLAIDQGRRDLRGLLDTNKTLSQCRKDLVQRNANPQMVAERALLAVRKTVT
jgi:DNA polymerase III delta prime subunit